MTAGLLAFYPGPIKCKKISTVVCSERWKEREEEDDQQGDGLDWSCIAVALEEWWTRLGTDQVDTGLMAHNQYFILEL